MIRHLAFVFLALSLFLTTACREHMAYGYSLSLYHTRSQQSFESTKAAFHSWLLAQGLTLSPSPGGMAEWSGGHSPDDQSTWYALSVGRNNLLLRVSASPQGRDIRASTHYDGAFTAAELAEMRRRNHRLWLEIIEWFETHAPDNTAANDAKKWLSDAKTKINDAYSK